MSKRIAGPVGAAVGLLVVLAPAGAWAQGYVQPQTSPFPHQAVSPYLNLLRGGNPAINYYGLVRPQQNFTNSINSLQAGQQALANQLPALAAEAAGPPPTGHPATFLNYSGYFLNLSGGAFPAALPSPAPILGTGPLFSQPMQRPQVPQGPGGMQVPRGNQPLQPGR